MNSYFRCFSVVILLYISFNISTGQTVTVKTELDTNRILPGQYTQLKYLITKSPESDIHLPTFTDTLFDGIEILGKAKIDSGTAIVKTGKIQQTLVVTAFEPGLHYIPPQPFILKMGNGNDTIFSAPSYIRVDSIAIDTSGKIRDIKEIEWIMPVPRDFIPIMLVMGIIGLIAFLIIYFWPGRREKALKAEAKVFEPAHIIALRELDKLKAQKLWQQKQLKEYYSRLTAIIRTYIEQQFGIKAMEETSAEIIADIEAKGISENINIVDLRKLLNLADLIKFAKGDANPEENIEHLERAYDFIKTSRQFFMEQAVKNAAEVVENNLSKSFKIAAKTKNAKHKSDLQIFKEIEGGGRLVRYQYTISIIVMTFSLNSKLFLLRKNDRGIKQGLPYSIITILFGWWGIPWGPVRSFVALKNNFSGGKNVELE